MKRYKTVQDITNVCLLIFILIFTCINFTACRDDNKEPKITSVGNDIVANTTKSTTTIMPKMSDGNSGTFVNMPEYITPINTNSGDENATVGDENGETQKHEGTMKTIYIRDFGAVGDGVTDDGPAINNAFKKMQEAGGNVHIEFDKKIYYIGERLDSWQYFTIYNVENVVIDGNGAELLFEPTNNTFFFSGCSDVTFKNIDINYKGKLLVQGTITAVDNTDGSFDLMIDDGSAVPPDDDWMAVNNRGYRGLGGEHAVVLTNDSSMRNILTQRDHLKFDSIVNIGNGMYRFYVKNEYLKSLSGIKTSERLVYNPGFSVLPLSKKDRAEGIEACSFIIIQSSDFQVENVNMYASPVKGYRVYDNFGQVVFRNSSIRPKPGSNALLSIGSDGIHAKNNRGSIIIENCTFERTNDDMVAILTMEEKVTRVDEPDKICFVSTEVTTYNYTILQGDVMEFYDRAKKKILGRAVVKEVTAGKGRERVVTLDKPLSQIAEDMDIENLYAVNQNQTSPGTVIRGNTFRPILRNSMLVRFDDGIIENNIIDSIGGTGIEAISEGPYSLNMTITGNIIKNTVLYGISVGNSAVMGVPFLHKNAKIVSNVIENTYGNGVRIINSSEVVIHTNKISMNSDANKIYRPLVLQNSENIVIDGSEINDPRANAPEWISLAGCRTETIQYR